MSGIENIFRKVKYVLTNFGSQSTWTNFVAYYFIYALVINLTENYHVGWTTGDNDPKGLSTLIILEQGRTKERKSLQRPFSNVIG